mmetsp:Transcript_30699/g.78456  ORF Transcript_30699/g.78456 Transcript_30699/m.78456 type:complete len:212 (+) Transcript_30699:192-827(+)
MPQAQSLACDPDTLCSTSHKHTATSSKVYISPPPPAPLPPGPPGRPPKPPRGDSGSMPGLPNPPCSESNSPGLISPPPTPPTPWWEGPADGNSRGPGVGAPNVVPVGRSPGVEPPVIMPPLPSSPLPKAARVGPGVGPGVGMRAPPGPGGNPAGGKPGGGIAPIPGMPTMPPDLASMAFTRAAMVSPGRGPPSKRCLAAAAAGPPAARGAG